MKKITLSYYGIEFKQLISGPAPVARIFNYLKLADSGRLKGSNVRSPGIPGKGDLWCLQFMIGLGLIRKGTDSDDKTWEIILTKQAKKIVKKLEKFPVVNDENMSIKDLHDMYSNDVIKEYESAFRKSCIFVVLKMYLDEKGYVQNKSTFLNDYYSFCQEKYDKSNSGDVLSVERTSGGATTGENRVPSTLQTCDFIGYAKVEGDKVTFDENKFKGVDIIMEKTKNWIMYGPPGTGKTYNTVIEAMKIVNPDMVKQFEDGLIDYDNLLDEFEKLEFKTNEDEISKKGQIGFVTFHQSYSYEEFVEGIWPKIGDTDEDGNESTSLGYTNRDGIFKAMCRAASAPTSIKIGDRDITNLLNSNPAIWKVSLKGTGDNDVRQDCLENGYIRIGNYDAEKDVDFDKEFYGKTVLNAYINKMKIGDIVLSCYSSNSIDAIGIVTGDYEWDDSFADYKRKRSVEWIYKNKMNILDINGGNAMTLSAVYKLYRIKAEDIFKKIGQVGSEVKRKGNEKKYVLIIDEINRGNISKIFGELITLIEEDKRGKLNVILPYTHESFTVPDNLYIIGTMNTADRSIASIDIALRRRFMFIEKMPDPELVPEMIEGIEFRKIFKVLNENISLMLDQDHQIGHSYFMGIETIEQLQVVWFNKIIPLINEYFYGDWQKIVNLLHNFVVEEDVPYAANQYNKKYSFVSKSISPDDFVKQLESLTKEREDG